MSAYGGVVRNTSGLISHWRLGEPSGTAVADVLGANGGTLEGVATLAQVGAIAGDSNTSYTFDGSTGYVNCGNNASLQLTTGSLELWCNTESPGNGFRGMAVKANAWGLFLIDGVLGMYDWGTDNTRDTLQDLTDGEWHHVVVTFQSTVVDGTIVYVDGVSVLTTTITVLNNLSPLVIGAGSTATQHYGEFLDEVAVYSSVLTQPQVAYHYNIGANGDDDNGYDNFVQLR
jgi:VCBS repeat-containing protein